MDGELFERVLQPAGPEPRAALGPSGLLASIGRMGVQAVDEPTTGHGGGSIVSPVRYKNHK